MRKLILFIFIIISNSLLAQDVQSPVEFIGDNYGASFTPHHILVDYIQHVASNSDLVSLEKYGETNEGRPLYLVYITSEENQQNLPAIRKANLASAGILKSQDFEFHKPIVWLSYSIHGNEAGGSEASMNVLYNLVTNKHDYKINLSDGVIIMDPSVNPDGYSRYSHWVNANQGKFVHPEHSDIEHMEPWPGGRVNHYLFDLNRDWAWQTQIESKNRAVVYNKWLPHIHADLHEMGYDDHYYFAPAAEPYHHAISKWQREFQRTIGKNHARYFDENGWLYFTGEVFDLLYPSYGDTWPTFNGSIGMTYEQAGHGMSGRSIEMSNGKNLTIQDRIDHHTTTSLSTIETTFENKKDILTNFSKYFKNSKNNPFGEYKYYVVKKGELSEDFIELMKNNQIQFEFINEGKKLNGYSYLKDSKTPFDTEVGDIYISAFQPKSTLLQVLMEKNPKLTDSLTYDITSWCLPLAYNLDAFAFTQKPIIKLIENNPFEKPSNKLSVGNYGVVFHYSQNFDAKVILAALLQKNIKVKTANKQIKIRQVTINRGDYIVLKADQKLDNWVSIIEDAVKDYDCKAESLDSGFSDQGTDLGGISLSLVKPPKVLTFFGESINANSYGQIWNYFENVLEYPLSRVKATLINRVDLQEYNTIILPDGFYQWDEGEKEKLTNWVKSGGKLISIAGANRMFKDNELFGLSKATPAENRNTSEENSEAMDRYRKRSYEGSERRSISGSMPGAIIKTEIDKSHPLCYGLSAYYTLKNSRSNYPLLGSNAYNPVYIPKNYDYNGFIGSQLISRFQNTFVFAEENIGAGKLVYMADNPLFRGFWKSGEIIFANALFQLN